MGSFAVLFFVGCMKQEETTPRNRHTRQSTTKKEPQQTPITLSEPITLSGVVLHKDWTKTRESWNAGGSDYYVLKVEDGNLRPDQQTAQEGVILRPSKSIPFESLAQYVGKSVSCRGEFIRGQPYIPPKDSLEQIPAPAHDPITGELDYPNKGSGFKVLAIEPLK